MTRAGEWWRSIRPGRRELTTDALAGLPGALATVPSGMAGALLAGAHPVQGLYANTAGPLAGGLSTSTPLLMVTTTSATALAAGSAMEGMPLADRPEAVSLRTLLAGLVMVVAGVARLGRYAHFVSHSVMTGFLTGVAVNIVCTQLPDLLGADAEGPIPVARALDVATNPSRIDSAALVLGAIAAVVLAVASRSRLAPLGALVAVLAPSLAVGVLGLDSVARVADVGAIPAGLPQPALPDPGLFNLGMMADAAAVALIVLLQGVGVSEAVPKERRGRPDTNHDFVGQGLGNVASGLLRGMPVGGSISQTLLMVTVGGRSRWAAIWTGVWVGISLLALSSLLDDVAMPTLAALLVVAAGLSIKPDEIATIWRTGRISQVAMAATFLAALFLSIPQAVGIGVALSLLLQLNREAMDLTVVRLTPDPDGDDGWIEGRSPQQLPDEEVVVLDVYGSLFYAGARTLQVLLPRVGRARSPVVVLRLRGRSWLGATALSVLADYADELGDAGGKLYLTGLRREVVDQMRRSGELDLDGPEVAVYEARPRVGASTTAAYEDAESWLVHRHTGG